jgi:hypothetical protein
LCRRVEALAELSVSASIATSFWAKTGRDAKLRTQIIESCADQASLNQTMVNIDVTIANSWKEAPDKTLGDVATRVKVAVPETLASFSLDQPETLPSAFWTEGLKKGVTHEDLKKIADHIMDRRFAVMTTAKEKQAHPPEPAYSYGYDVASGEYTDMVSAGLSTRRRSFAPRFRELLRSRVFCSQPKPWSASCRKSREPRPPCPQREPARWISDQGGAATR